jgi:hypothetical protein
MRQRKPYSDVRMMVVAWCSPVDKKTTLPHCNKAALIANEERHGGALRDAG